MQSEPAPSFKFNRERWRSRMNSFFNKVLVMMVVWVFYLPSALSDSVEKRMSKIGTRYWSATTAR